MLFKEGRFLEKSGSSPHHTVLACNICVYSRRTGGCLCVHSGAQCFWNRIDLGFILSLTLTSCVTSGKSLCFGLTTRLIVITVVTILASLSPTQHLWGPGGRTQVQVPCKL